jgi:molybdate/tungstate transport system substrate-binding protein
MPTSGGNPHPRPSHGSATKRIHVLTACCAVGLMLIAAACSSSKKTTTPTTAAAAKGSGPVDVASAGSLQGLMTNLIGPGFKKSTGYTFVGTSGDSGTLATEIEAGTQVTDIFISANPAKNAGLMGTANKNLVSWYAEWATSPLVIGYSPTSKFATDLKTMPWYQVLALPGILIGRTDPASDPAGALAVTALTAAATKYNEPALTAITTSTSNVYPETTLVGRLQSGQLDVGFFYDIEAKGASPAIPTVPLTGDSGEAAMYTITILNNAAHTAGAQAFVEYLVGPDAKSALDADGLTLVSPAVVTGTPPAALSSVLPG